MYQDLSRPQLVIQALQDAKRQTEMASDRPTGAGAHDHQVFADQRLDQRGVQPRLCQSVRLPPDGMPPPKASSPADLRGASTVDVVMVLTPPAGCSKCRGGPCTAPPAAREMLCTTLARISHRAGRFGGDFRPGIAGPIGRVPSWTRCGRSRGCRGRFRRCRFDRGEKQQLIRSSPHRASSSRSTNVTTIVHEGQYMLDACNSCSIIVTR